MIETYKILSQMIVPNPVGIVYTVPADTAAIIKRIIVANPTAGASNFSLYANGTGAGNILMPPFAVAAAAFYDNDRVITLADGDTLQALSSVAATLTITIFGVELS